MECPRCKYPITYVKSSDGNEVVAQCKQCGWGKQPGGLLDDQMDARPGTLDYLKLMFAWVVGLALVIGPYVALLIYWPSAPPWIHIAYWLGMAVYLMAAATTTPEVDTDNLGWAGGLIDNPFSFQDDFNRKVLFFTIALIPGKIACYAIAATYRLIRG